jgi:hypothetical protein
MLPLAALVGLTLCIGYATLVGATPVGVSINGSNAIAVVPSWFAGSGWEMWQMMR